MFWCRKTPIGLQLCPKIRTHPPTHPYSKHFPGCSGLDGAEATIEGPLHQGFIGWGRPKNSRTAELQRSLYMFTRLSESVTEKEIYSLNNLSLLWCVTLDSKAVSLVPHYNSRKRVVQTPDFNNKMLTQREVTHGAGSIGN